MPLIPMIQQPQTIRNSQVIGHQVVQVNYSFWAFVNNELYTMDGIPTIQQPQTVRNNQVIGYQVILIKDKFWTVVNNELYTMDAADPNYVWHKSSFWPDFLKWENGNLSQIPIPVIQGQDQKLCNCPMPVLLQAGCKCGGT